MLYVQLELHCTTLYCQAQKCAMHHNCTHWNALKMKMLWIVKKRSLKQCCDENPYKQCTMGSGEGWSSNGRSCRVTGGSLWPREMWILLGLLVVSIFKCGLWVPVVGAGRSLNQWIVWTGRVQNKFWNSASSFHRLSSSIFNVCSVGWLSCIGKGRHKKTGFFPEKCC